MSRQISPAALRLEGLVVKYLLERLVELPEESVRDIFSLVEGVTPDASAEEKNEIFETIEEILCPESIGEIHFGRTGSVEGAPDNLQKRIDYVGGTLKKKRKSMKLTQKKLAEKSGLPQSHISRLETGQHSPSRKTLEKIAKALGVTVGDLDSSHRTTQEPVNGRPSLRERGPLSLCALLPKISSDPRTPATREGVRCLFLGGGKERHCLATRIYRAMRQITAP